MCKGTIKVARKKQNKTKKAWLKTLCAGGKAVREQLITSLGTEGVDGVWKTTESGREGVKQTWTQRADKARAEKTALGPEAFVTRDPQSCSSVSTGCRTCWPTSSYSPHRSGSFLYS